MTGIDAARVRAAVADLLSALGEDPARPGLAETPARVAEAYGELFSGVGVDAAAILAEGSMRVERPVTEPVSLVGVPFRSMCEHHLLPFEGTVSLAYLPDERLAGLGRLARAVDVIASRPQLQERFTEELADALDAGLAPKGVLVLASATHSCVRDRGVRSAHSGAVTLASRGALAEPGRRDEALRLLAVPDAGDA